MTMTEMKTACDRLSSQERRELVEYLTISMPNVEEPVPSEEELRD
jgi:DNA primase catalytic subunit